MKAVENLAYDTLKVAYKDEPPQIVIEILTIISIIVGIIGIIQRCKAANVADRVKNHKPSDRIAIRRIMRKHLTREQFKSESGKILTGLLKVGEDTSPEDIQKAYEEGINENN